MKVPALHALLLILGVAVSCSALALPDEDELAHIVFNNYIAERETSSEASGPDVRFILYTKRNPVSYDVINITNKEGLANTHFDFSQPTKILVFGWGSNIDANFPVTVRDAYTYMTDYNVIVADWAPIAQWNYIEASRVVRLIGDFIAQALGLFFEYGVRPESVHLIGHSLGAHVVGVAGKNSPIPLQRVTGLDPAAPLFSLNDPYRITNKSALFVDIIHTCGDYLGFFDTIGDADFYPNGGRHTQPGCGWDLEGWCSHRRAFWYFSESIYMPGSFIGLPCEGWDSYGQKCNTNRFAEMGEYVPWGIRGKYYLKTNTESPYGRGKLYP